MTAAIEALIRHAVPAEPPKVKGVWAIIRFSPSLTTGDRLNVGVLLCVNSKQSYRLTDSAPFACLFGEAWEESVRFLLRALEEALQAGRDIGHFSPHIEIDGWRPAAGDSVDEILDRLFACYVMVAQKNRPCGRLSKRGADGRTPKKEEVNYD